MTDYNEEYFVLEQTPEPEEAPFLVWEEDNERFDGTPIPAEEISPISLAVGEPEPHKPEMVDYHDLDQPVFSEKIKMIIEGLKIKGVQLIPCNIQVGDEVHSNYWYLYINNRLKGCLNLEDSDYDTSPKGAIELMTTISLNYETLEEIPLEERLIFLPQEFPYTEFYHVSVVEKILEASPVGFEFEPLSEWML